MDLPANTQLTITARADGQVVVNGPLQDKIFCLGLLKMAEHVIVNFDPAKQTPQVLLARAMPHQNGP